MQNPVRPRTRLRRAGFTLVESVILISIVGIIAVTAAPRILSISDLRATSAHRQALADLRFGHQLATASGCPVQVDFSATGYVMTQRTGCRTGPFTQDIVDPTTNAPAFSIAVPSGTTLTSSIDPLIFNSLGETTNAAGITTDADVTIGSRSLQVVGETGLVRVP